MTLPTGQVRSNFSLIEVVMVAGLLVLVMGLAATTFSGVSSEGRFKHGVNALVLYINTMRHRSVTLQKPLRIVYDIPNQKYWAEIIPLYREAMDETEIEKLRLLVKSLPDGMVFEEVQLGPDEAETDDAISFDIDQDGMIANHHIYVRSGDYSARIEVHAISGLIDVVSIEGERLADNWPQPSLATP